MLFVWWGNDDRFEEELRYFITHIVVVVVVVDDYLCLMILWWRIWGYLITHIVVVVVVDDDYLCLMILWWRIWGGVGLDHSHSCKMKRQQRKSSFNWDILTTTSSSPKASHEQHLTSFWVIDHKKWGPNSKQLGDNTPCLCLILFAHAPFSCSPLTSLLFFLFLLASLKNLNRSENVHGWFPSFSSTARLKSQVSSECKPSLSEKFRLKKQRWVN